MNTHTSTHVYATFNYDKKMRLNDGYAYREVLTPRALGEKPQSILSYLARRYPHSTLIEWQTRLNAGEVRIGNTTATGDENLAPGQEVVWNRPPWAEAEVPLHAQLIYLDQDLLAVAKPSGLPTLPGGGFLKHTLLHLMRLEYPEASPLHRLGRGTSGLVLFARTRQAAAGLSQSWREHEVHKTYLALATGRPENSQYDITTPIGPVPHPLLGSLFAANPRGRASRSRATVLEQRTASVLFSVDIETGRPHQIRIHLASIGHPLVGDPLYMVGGGPSPDLPRLPGDGGYLLHAAQLSFVHPRSGKALQLQAPVPAILRSGNEPKPGI